MQNWEKMADMLRDAYIEAYGAEKWNSLDDEEKADVIRLLAGALTAGLNAVK